MAIKREKLSSGGVAQDTTIFLNTLVEENIIYRAPGAHVQLKQIQGVNYIPAGAFDEILYDARKNSRVIDTPSNLDNILREISEGSDGRYVFALGEKRVNENMGHMLAVVVDKKSSSYQVSLCDSKSENSILMFIWCLIMRYLSRNSDCVLEKLLEEKLGKNVDLKRYYYGHQASAFNYSCTGFAARAMYEVIISDSSRSIEDIVESIPSPGIFAGFYTQTTFLTNNQIKTFEDARYKSQKEDQRRELQAVAATIRQSKADDVGLEQSSEHRPTSFNFSVLF